jgi:hypothetical protein
MHAIGDIEHRPAKPPAISSHALARSRFALARVHTSHQRQQGGTFDESPFHAFLLFGLRRTGLRWLRPVGRWTLLPDFFFVRRRDVRAW